MDRVLQIVGDIPPNTLAWMGLICCLSFVTTNRFVAPAKLVFVPGKVAQEPWRVVTLFFFLGNFLIYFLQALFLISRCLASFESRYSLHHDIIPQPLMNKLDSPMKERLDRSMLANRTIDYTYFMLSVALSIVVMARAVEATTSVQLLFLGPVLEKVIHYLSCRIAPDENFFYYGIRMPARYSPWLLAGLEILFDRDYHLTFREMVQTRSMAAAWRFLASQQVIQLSAALIIGHVWWFVRFFLMTEVYGEWVNVFDKSSGSAWPGNLGRVFLQYLLTPPWYYYTIYRMLREEPEYEPLDDIDPVDPVDTTIPTNSTVHPAEYEPQNQELLQDPESDQPGPSELIQLHHSELSPEPSDAADSDVLVLRESSPYPDTLRHRST